MRMYDNVCIILCSVVIQEAVTCLGFQFGKSIWLISCLHWALWVTVGWHLNQFYRSLFIQYYTVYSVEQKPTRYTTATVGTICNNQNESRICENLKKVCVWCEPCYQDVNCFHYRLTDCSGQRRKPHSSSSHTVHSIWWWTVPFKGWGELIRTLIQS